MKAEEQLREFESVFDMELARYCRKIEEIEVEETQVRAKLTALRAEVKIVLKNR